MSDSYVDWEAVARWFRAGQEEMFDVLVVRHTHPAAVAALDRAVAENVKLRVLFDRFGQYLDHAYQCGLRNGASGRCTCGLVDFVKQVAELGAST